MNSTFWLMAAYHELEQPEVAPEPLPVAEPEIEPPIIVPDRSKKLSCPKCGKTGRGIVIHIRNCKG